MFLHQILNKKGQGITEYGITLLFVALLGVSEYYSGNIGQNISSLYSAASTRLHSIVNGPKTDYDTGITFTDSQGNVWHQTSLIYQTMDGADDPTKDYRVYWFINDGGKGNKEYKVGMSARGGGNSLQAYLGGTSYFEDTDGKYYKLVENGGSNTTIEQVSGTSIDTHKMRNVLPADIPNL